MAGQVGVYGILGPGKASLGVLALELPAVVRVGDPLAEHVQLLARISRGHGADDVHILAVLGLETEDGVAVFFICIDHGSYLSVELLKFFLLQLVPFFRPPDCG